MKLKKVASADSTHEDTTFAEDTVRRLQPTQGLSSFPASFTDSCVHNNKCTAQLVVWNVTKVRMPYRHNTTVVTDRKQLQFKTRGVLHQSEYASITSAPSWFMMSMECEQLIFTTRAKIYRPDIVTTLYHHHHGSVMHTLESPDSSPTLIPSSFPPQTTPTAPVTEPASSPAPASEPRASARSPAHAADPRQTVRSPATVPTPG